MLRRLCSIAALALAAGAPGSALAQGGISVNIGQPGFYGRIDIGGNVPPPQLLYPEPVLVQPPPYRVQRAPIYLRVPPGHAKHWGRHCARYNACGQPVYFVQDRWYNEVYAPRYRSGPPGWRQPDYAAGPPPGYFRDRDDDWRQGRHEGHPRRDRDRDHHGRGHGHGRDPDHRGRGHGGDR